MLRICVPAVEMWDERTKQFVYIGEQTLQLEHSLVSIQKWESKWCKPFLTDKPKTYEESLDYIRCMTTSQNVDPMTYKCLTNENINEIDEYIRAPMTATTFSDDKSTKRSREIVTAEVIYHWMIAQNIPSEYREWHLNSLLALIRTCSVKNSPSKKRSTKEIAAQNAALNAARRAKLNSKG